MAGTELPAQLAERPIRHARHWGDHETVGESVLADLHAFGECVDRKRGC
jgi:hypothetical protein